MVDNQEQEDVMPQIEKNHNPAAVSTNKRLVLVHNSGDTEPTWCKELQKIWHTSTPPFKFRFKPFPVYRRRDTLAGKKGILDILATFVHEGDVLFLPAHLLYVECPNAGAGGGIELLKHLRFAPDGGTLSHLPVIIALEGPPEHYARLKPDNTLLFSPGCALTSLPPRTGELCRLFEAARSVHDFGEPREILSPYVVWTRGDLNARGHSFRNKVGVKRFLLEFAGHALPEDPRQDPVVRAHEEDLVGELWLKKMLFVGDQQTAEIAPDLKPNVCERYHNGRFLYIDDQHRLGWSYGLYAGLFLNDNSAEEAFESARNSIKQDVRYLLFDRRLCLVDDFDEAMSRLKDEQKNLNNLIDRWKIADAKYRPEDDYPEGKPAWEKAFRDLRDWRGFSIMFLDVRLKGEQDEGKDVRETSGFKILEWAKEALPYLPIIMMTASEKSISAEEARRLHADEFWTKAVSSGAELRDDVWRCLEKADLQKQWLGIQMLERKSCLPCYSWDAAVRHFLPRPLCDWSEVTILTEDQIEEKMDRELIIAWLREAWRLLWDAEVHKHTGHRSDYPYNQVVLNLGLAQEKRLGDPPRRFGWGTHSNFSFHLDEDDRQREINIHSRRSDTAHSARHGVLFTRDEAIEWMNFTINCLLGNDFLSPVPDVSLPEVS